MAEDSEIAIKLVLETDNANLTLKELEDGFEAMSEEIKGLGRGTDRFKELSAAMAGTSAELQNIEAGFEGLGTEAMAGQMGGLAGGIGDVTASLVLMGGENETIEQIGASIEKAMAISMGFKGVIEGSQAGMKLYNSTIKNSTLFQKLNNATTVIAAAVMKLFKGSVDATSKSFKTLKTAIAATGIGLLVVGVAALVANFGKIKDAINGVSAATKDLVASNVLNTEASKGNLEAINGSNNLLRQQGKTEKEILQIKLIANKAHLEDLEADLEGNKKLNKEKVEGAKWLQETLLQTLEILFFIPRTILKLVDLVTKTFADMINDITQDPIMKKVLGLEPVNFDFGIAEGADDLLDQATRLIFDPEAVDEAGKAEQKILEDNLLKQKETIAGHELSLEAIGKKGLEAKNKTIDEQKVIDEKAAEDAKILAAELLRTLDDLEAKAIEDKNVRALAEKELAHDREREALILKHGENAELLAALDAAQLLEMNALDDSIEQEAIDKEAERVAAAKAIKDAADEASDAKDIKDAADKQAQRDKDFALASASIGALSALNKAATDTALLNAAGDEKKKEKIRKASFEREKKLNIAMALINGAQAVLAGFAQGGLPMAIIAGVTAAAQLAAILATTYQGGGSVKQVDNTAPVEPDGAGGGGGGAQINPVTNTSTILGNQQVYVTETDITDTQNNVSVIEESATF